MEQKNQADIQAEVERVLDVLRKGLIAHGGNVELVEVDAGSGKVSLRMQGACVGCPLSELTFKAGIEETLLQMVPEVKEVILVA